MLICRTHADKHHHQYSYNQTCEGCRTVRLRKKPPDTDQEPGDQAKLVSSQGAPLERPGLQQIPKEKITQDQTICPQQVFVCGDTGARCLAPRSEAPSQLRIIVDETNGNGDND